MKTVELLIAHDLDEFPLANAYVLATGLPVFLTDTNERDFFGAHYGSIISFRGEDDVIDELLERHQDWVYSSYQQAARRAKRHPSRPS